jgi:hypothetical protein
MISPRLKKLSASSTSPVENVLDKIGVADIENFPESLITHSVFFFEVEQSQGHSMQDRDLFGCVNPREVKRFIGFCD